MGPNPVAGGIPTPGGAKSSSNLRSSIMVTEQKEERASSKVQQSSFDQGYYGDLGQHCARKGQGPPRCPLRSETTSILARCPFLVLLSSDLNVWLAVL